MQSSTRSKVRFLPRFPRLQYQRRRRRDDYKLDIEHNYKIHVLPNGKPVTVH